MKVIHYLFLFWIILSLSADSSAQSNVQTLVDSKLAFAKTAADEGIKKAFLTFLADNSVLFRPRVVKGKK